MSVEVEKVADENLVESVRAHARWQSPCSMEEGDGLLMIAGSTPFPGAYKNVAIRTEASLAPATMLERVRAFFGGRARGFTIYTRASCDGDLERALEEAGIARRADSPCMVVERPVPVPSCPPGFRAEFISSEEHVRDCAAVNAEAYQALGLPPAETLALFADPARVLAACAGGFLAYGDGRPLAAALLIANGGSAAGAGLYWVGTVPDAQGKGLAAHCTALATNAAFENGAGVVTLQASAAGEPIYRRLGYREIDRLHFYRHSAPRP